ncbi:tRNA (adenosine(37)-N6)-threonylcarbamoyltransferase complex dimerization subunit type 1 TsaB [Compostibacter hankyongensis]|uniref:tRNA (Adenosine(37)-N6)-threonylcarbamoyltransferase complex dimerization subunit type 1 TsaB n=1 Tax=Compostibacter hankyongensis TaxID=1007089 RepID=A0ABP8FDP8_9BACT
MAVILCIDTSGAQASVCLARDGAVTASVSGDSRKDHAAATVPFIRQLLEDSGLGPEQLSAVAVSAGPGSYTGLRVGVATAKGLCYTWGIPLIPINTLKMMAQGVRPPEPEGLLCPMIDARRQEVYTALYDSDLQEVLPPEALVLDKTAFAGELSTRQIYFFGSGAAKWQAISSSPRACFLPYTPDAGHLAPLAEIAFHEGQSADPAYFEPFYLKPFYTPV